MIKRSKLLKDCAEYIYSNINYDGDDTPGVEKWADAHYIVPNPQARINEGFMAIEALASLESKRDGADVYWCIVGDDRPDDPVIFMIGRSEEEAVKTLKERYKDYERANL